MKLEEAIETLNDLLVECPQFPPQHTRTAVKLGLEALKRLQDNRQDPEFDHWLLLPGETEE